MSKILYTPKASELCGREDPSRGPVEGVLRYYNAAGDELNVTTDEWEEWERETGNDAEDDTLNACEWASFLQFLGLNKAEEPATANGASRVPAHTPTPWRASKTLKQSPGMHMPFAATIYTADETEVIGTITGNSYADVDERKDRIVRAVNSHAELVVALTECKAVINGFIATNPTLTHLAKVNELAAKFGGTMKALAAAVAAEDALAKAKGQP